MTKRSAFEMAGTEGTGEYIVIARTRRGRIGIRILEGTNACLENIKEARVRVEPSKSAVKTVAEQLKGWKQPSESQCRFSTMVDAADAKASLIRGMKALGAGKLKTALNPDAPEWAKQLC